MKKNVLTSLLCLVLLTAVLAACLFGVNALTAPIVEANEKARLGDSVLIYDRNAPEASELTVTADTVQSIYKDDTKQVYTLHLASFEGYTKSQAIELTLVLDYEGHIVSLTLDASGETKNDLLDTAAFLPSFEGQDSALAGVELVAGATFTSNAIKNAVNDGFNTMIENGLFAAGEKSEDQLLQELVPLAYPGIVNKAGVIQGEELAASGSATAGYKAANGSGCLWFVEKDGEKLLAVYSVVGGVSLYNAQSEVVTDQADPALIEEIRALSADQVDDLSQKQMNALGRMLPEGAELVPVEIPGLTNSITGAYTVETEEGTLYAFAARPYGYSNEVMEFYFVLDESGAIAAFRCPELILHAEYFSNYTLDEPAYKEGFLGLTAESYTGEQAQITGATMSSDAADTAVNDVFEAFWLLTESRG